MRSIVSKHACHRLTMSVRITSLAPKTAAATPGSPIPHPSSNTLLPRTFWGNRARGRAMSVRGELKLRVFCTVDRRKNIDHTVVFIKPAMNDGDGVGKWVKRFFTHGRAYSKIIVPRSPVDGLLHRSAVATYIAPLQINTNFMSYRVVH